MPMPQSSCSAQPSGLLLPSLGRAQGQSQATRQHALPSPPGHFRRFPDPSFAPTAYPSRPADLSESPNYYEIIRGRLDVVREFNRMVPTAKERVIQNYIFDHLWLLDAS